MLPELREAGYANAARYPLSATVRALHTAGRGPQPGDGAAQSDERPLAPADRTGACAGAREAPERQGRAQRFVELRQGPGDPLLVRVALADRREHLFDGRREPRLLAFHQRRDGLPQTAKGRRQRRRRRRASLIPLADHGGHDLVGALRIRQISTCQRIRSSHLKIHFRYTP
ncbi:hypothetical protein San01_50460 [Streptomyces angustmyceticus]|uniref:Uncharacterized protein n=1 Tax=Streptomyces angustmyceticus TaxID=285578 RepID=A0A5J4LM33_9ACTN|nr:hypothetical protein San01_50460 [Streptomyces angustmyceticus]